MADKESARAVKRYRIRARKKLGRKDPQPPSRVKLIKRRMRELEEKLAASP
ncbi:MAG TPA: hypothetical protein VHB73_08305 [Alphaproteobacteria bacterium]|nr:hypothetical protein [Alphaproteobacteria bacterium]